MQERTAETDFSFLASFVHSSSCVQWLPLVLCSDSENRQMRSMAVEGCGDVLAVGMVGQTPWHS